MSRTHRFASGSTLVLAALAAIPALSMWPLLGTGDNGEFSRGAVAWIILTTVLGVVLVCGLVLRAQSRAPRLATALLVLGAPSPSMAWFWLPPLYALSVAVIVLALTTHRRATGPAAA